MEDNTTNFIFRGVSTALLVSTVALFISAIAFVILYQTDDAFGAAVCLFVVVPVMLVAATLFTIRDAINRHTWRQTVTVMALVVSSALLVTTATSIRFALHQLFTFRSIDLHLPANRLVFFEKFTVCPQGQSCEPRSTVMETRSFSLKKMPDGCCLLSVISPRRVGEAVDAFRVTLNGRKVELPASARNGASVAPVELRIENQISVQLSGAPGAHLYLVISSDGKEHVPRT